MTVHQGHRVVKGGCVLRLGKHSTAGQPAFIIGTVGQVKLVVHRALHNGIVHLGTVHLDPSVNFVILALQLFEIYRIGGLFALAGGTGRFRYHTLAAPILLAGGVLLVQIHTDIRQSGNQAHQGNDQQYDPPGVALLLFFRFFLIIHCLGVAPWHCRRISLKKACLPYGKQAFAVRLIQRPVFSSWQPELLHLRRQVQGR